MPHSVPVPIFFTDFTRDSGRTEVEVVVSPRNVPQLRITVLPGPLPVPAGTRTQCASPSMPAFPTKAAGRQAWPAGLGLYTWLLEG